MGRRQKAQLARSLSPLVSLIFVLSTISLIALYGVLASMGFAKFSPIHYTPLAVAVGSKRPYVMKLVCEAYLSSQYLRHGLFLSSRELEEHFADVDQRRVARRVLVDIYAAMSIEGIVCGVPRDFRSGPAQAVT